MIIRGKIINYGEHEFIQHSSEEDRNLYKKIRENFMNI